MAQSGGSGHSSAFPPPVWSPSVPPPSYVSSDWTGPESTTYPPPAENYYSTGHCNNVSTTQTCGSHQQATYPFTTSVSQAPPPAAPYHSYTPSETQQISNSNQFISRQNQTPQDSKASPQSIYIPPYPPPPAPPGTTNISVPYSSNYSQINNGQNSTTQWSNEVSAQVNPWCNTDSSQNSTFKCYDNDSNSYRSLPYKTELIDVWAVLPKPIDRSAKVVIRRESRRSHRYSPDRFERGISERRCSRDRLSESRCSRDRLSESRCSRDRLSESRCSRDRLSERRCSRDRLSERRCSRDRQSEGRFSHDRQSERRFSHDRQPERRYSRDRLSERRCSRDRLSERRCSRDRPSERRCSRDRLSERRCSRGRQSEMRCSRDRQSESRCSRDRQFERRRSPDRQSERIKISERSSSMRSSPHNKRSYTPEISKRRPSLERHQSRRYESRSKDIDYRSGSSSERKLRQGDRNRNRSYRSHSRHSKTPRRQSLSRPQRLYSRSPGRKRSVSRRSREHSVVSTREGENIIHAPYHTEDTNERPFSPSSDTKFEESDENIKKESSERDVLLKKWRQNYCSNIAEMQMKLEELSKLKPEQILEHEKKVWIRSAPADLYYMRDEEPEADYRLAEKREHPTHVGGDCSQLWRCQKFCRLWKPAPMFPNIKVMRATPKLIALCEKFEYDLVKRATRIRASQKPYDPPPRKKRLRVAKHKSEIRQSSSSSSGESTTDEEDCTMEELEKKRLHPYRLHQEMWFNDAGEMNDGPLCRCSARARRRGIRHGIYAGESHLLKCDINTNNADRLYHYHITISPPTNFLTKTPTIIKHDEHEFIFEGFSMFSHFPLHKLPTCKVIRFNIEYTILYIEEKLPENFTIRELDLFYNYLFREILELVDLDFHAHSDSSGCAQFHFMPRFVRDLPDNGKEILSMNEVMLYLMNNSHPLVDDDNLEILLNMPQYKWQNFADELKGMVVTYPGMKPCSVRVDQLDRDQQSEKLAYPEIVHFGIRPPQLSYAGNPEYQKAWREYVKFRHLLANMPKPSFEDKRKLEAKENRLQEMRTQSKMKRDVTVAVSAKGFHRTGIMCDVIQHAMLIPVLVCHLRFHRSCDVLEKNIGYKFENRFLLQLALTHPSYRENFGTNPDHARNSLTNCGIRQPEYGDRRIHYMNTRKRGINTLINIMSRFGKKTETESNITHNERLEFLGDAVVEFLSSIHLFHMFPDLEEGGLATYRAAIVQNQHLAVLAKTLKLEDYMLYAHGSDLCHDLELRHAMANCFEALMGALFLDGGIEVADKVFSETLFKDDPDLLDVWVNYPPHPLQEQEPLGDRKWIASFELLQKLTKFEESIGVEFKHIRLLARAFTDRSIGYTNLTLGSNQRLEFLGDTVLQLIASEYLYKYFPEHHEGHLSLLRSSLVNNRTQAVVCDDLGMTNYALYSNPKAELKTKDRADLLEAFLGALYVDKGLKYCQVFCHVCFFPRLQDFIMNQDWNDPKSKLQQCCLTLRTMEGGEPDIPLYKVIECKGPTNTRVYTVAVYFRGERLAKASGHSIQQAEMSAAKEALEISQGLFPQLDHQKRVIAKSMKKQTWPKRTSKNKKRSSRPSAEGSRHMKTERKSHRD